MQSDLSIIDGLDGFGDACYVIRLGHLVLINALGEFGAVWSFKIEYNSS